MLDKETLDLALDLQDARAEIAECRVVMQVSRIRAALKRKDKKP
jgi:hypothetical protein